MDYFRFFWGEDADVSTNLLLVFGGMALIGEAAARYIGLSQPISTGFVATLAYLGPRGAEALLAAWLCRKAAAAS